MIYTVAAKDSLMLFGVGPLDTEINFVANNLAAGSFPATVLGALGHPAGLVPADDPSALSSPQQLLTLLV
jgi:hypothetical protein